MAKTRMATTAATNRTAATWQTLLLLGPVVILAVMGLWSLRQDRLLVEQDARVQAGLLGESMVREFTKRLEGEVAGYLQAAPARRTGPLGFVEGDRVISPPDFPDILNPPEWLGTAPAGVISVWHEALAALRADRRVEAAALLSTLSTNPVPELAACVRFQERVLANTQGAERVRELIDLARKYPGLATDTGMPLADLALLQALRMAPSGTALDELIFAIKERLEQAPTLFSSDILEALERLVAASEPARRDSVRDVRLSHDAAERTRGLLRMLMAAGLLGPGVRMVGTGPDRTFAFVMPDVRGGPGAGEERKDRLRVTLIPATVIDSAIGEVANRGRGAWPPYMSLEVLIDGYQAGLSVPATGDANGVVPARKDGATPATPEATLATRKGRLAVGDGSAPFTVEVRLSDRELLFARQRQRTWMFGGLVLAATGIAGLGALLMQRNLARQFRLNEDKSNFVSSVSHELRAPIASMRLLAEGLEGGRIQEPARQRQYFQFIVQECRRLSALVENVLDVARIEQGRKLYELEPMDLGAMVQATLSIMDPGATERGCTLRWEAPGDSGPATGRPGADRKPAPDELDSSRFHCLGDGKALQQALVNLIDNALKHSPKGAVVRVGLERVDAAWLHLFVEDSGEGIPAEEHKRIFERFYRRGSELRRETPGVGIGLNIVKHVAEAHGGRVTVRSAVGQGSRFTLVLPVGTGTPTQPPHPLWNES